MYSKNPIYKLEDFLGSRVSEMYGTDNNEILRNAQVDISYKEVMKNKAFHDFLLSIVHFSKNNGDDVEDAHTRLLKILNKEQDVS